MGILDIVIGQAHISGLSNGENLIEDGRNGLGGKKEKCHGIRVCVNFLVTCRNRPSFIMAHGEKPGCMIQIFAYGLHFCYTRLRVSLCMLSSA
jgi:hypothetical protein